MRIERYEVELAVDAKFDPLKRSPAKGCLMHGVMMESIANEQLHVHGAQRPFTQYLMQTDEFRYSWVINLLCPLAAAPVKNWITNLPDRLFLRHHQIQLDVRQVSRTVCLSYAQMTSDMLEDDLPDTLRLDFITPILFKRSGSDNVNPLPTPRLLTQSAIRKWNEFSPGPHFEESEVLEQLDRNIGIRDFALKYQHVALDRSNLCGSVGHMVLKCSKDQDVQRLFNLLFKFGEFAGFGAKTAMGLGAVEVSSLAPRRRRKKSACQSPTERGEKSENRVLAIR